MTAHLLATIVQAGAEWAPVLSVGALVALGGVAATFGAVRAIASRNEKAIDGWRQETREDFKDVRQDIKELQTSVNRLSVRVAQIQGHGGHDDEL